MSIAFHPQTDGQLEAVNKTITMYLRCLTGDRPRDWLDLLPWAEFCYNSAYHTTLQTSPFQVVYGRPPPDLLPYAPGQARTDVVDALLVSRDEFLEEVRGRLLQAQQYARRFYDAHHRALEFAIGDWVLLRLLHRHTQSLVPGGRSKLGPKYAGLFRCLNALARLPTACNCWKSIHDVFHVGVLKPFRGAPPTSQPALPPLRHGRPLLHPERVLRAELRRGVWHVLVEWTGMPASEATWEPVPVFREAYPSFQLTDELFPVGGRDVMVGKTYQRRHQQGG